MNIIRIAAALLAASAAATGAAADTVTTNIIVNGGFDDTTSGWTGSWSIRDTDPSITTGSYYYGGASNAYNSITQRYTLSVSELFTMTEGFLSYEMSADLFSWHTQNDVSTLSASFRDALDNELGSASLSSATLYDGSWGTSLVAGSEEIYQMVRGVLPSGISSIVFSVEGVRNEGGNNDAYLDNASFKLIFPPEPVPLPAAAPFALAGIGALWAMGRRRG